MKVVHLTCAEYFNSYE